MCAFNEVLVKGIRYAAILNSDVQMPSSFSSVAGRE